MLYCIDSNTFIWGIKKQAEPADEHRLSEALALIKWIDDSKHQMLLPTVVLAECLIREPEERHPEIMAEAYKRFIVADFDSRCALKYGELLRLEKWELAKGAAREHDIRREKMKLDHMIICCALVNGAKGIFSNDKDVHLFGNGIIDVHYVNSITRQSNMFKQEPLNFGEHEPKG